MVAARSAARGLSPADLDGIRESLAAGRRPKVVFTESAGQIAGQAGQVVRVGDPDGTEEFVTVRFGKDELPFSPADLTIPPRGAARKAEPAKAEPAPDGGKAKEAPELRLTSPPVPAPREQPAPAAPTVNPAAEEPPAAPRKAG